MVTVVDLLQRHAHERGSDRAFVFVGSDVATEDSVSYAELDAAARRVGAALSERAVAGRPVLLLYPPGRAYVEGFLGCLYAGAIAVPAYPPDPSRLERTLPRLRALIADCGASLAIGPTWLVEAARSGPGFAPGLDWLATDSPLGCPRDSAPASPGADAVLGWPAEPSWEPPALDARAPALLQYTSGSTGSPKGVLLDHANLLHNAELVRIGFGTTPDEVGLSWLPPYHDMGLIGGILQPIYVRMPTVLMSPLDFVQRPLAWLEAITRYGVTMSGGPNFAFDLCVHKSTADQRASLDLSRWSLAFCGAEPVRADTLERFASAFAVAGFRREAFYPCYGLAEATLIVTGGRLVGSGLVGSGDTVHVSCGSVLGDQQLAIVDPSSLSPCTAGSVGEIWVSGGSVARGYWGRPDDPAFAGTLAGRRYLRTGDLGFQTPAGELVVTGRIKDLIVVRGRNVYPQDLEHAIETHVPGVRQGCTAAFAVDGAESERVAVACEVSGTADPDAVVAGILDVLATSAEVSPVAIVLLQPRRIPKTSSGKIQRHACREALVGGQWDSGVVARWSEAVSESGTGSGTWSGAGSGSGLGLGFGPEVGPVAGGGDAVAQLLVAAESGSFDAATPLTRLGLDSLRAVELRHALDDRFGVDVPLSRLLGGMTVGEVADLVHRSAPTEPATPATSATLAGASPMTVEMRHTADGARHTADGAHHTADEMRHTPVGEGVRGLWLLETMGRGAGAYDITRAVRVRTVVDVGRLERAFVELVRRHPALRSCLPAVRGEPVWRVLDPPGSVLERYDAGGLDEGELASAVRRDARRPFDLERGPLFRAALYSMAADDHVLLLSVHHVVADFWSLSVLVDDLLALYSAAGGRAGEPSSSWPVGPVDRGGAERLDYWRRMLDGAPTALELPATRARPKVQSFRGAAHRFTIEPALLAAVDALARDAGATRFATLLAGFAALLGRYAGDDVVIGTPTAGRDDRRTAHAVGYFVNPVPLRLRPRPGTTFRELVGQARAAVLGALDHAVPFGRLVQAVRPPADPSRSPVVQAMLTLQQPPAGLPDLGAFALGDDTARARLGPLDVQPYRLDDRGAAFDVALTLAEVGGGLSASLEYCADLFDEPMIERLANQFTMLLAGAAAEPETAVERLPLMDGAERAAVLALGDGGPPVATAPVHATLTERFDRQVAERPDATAVVCGSTALSYAELGRRTTELAALLRGPLGVRRGDLVGVLLPRHEDAVVAFWAVLQAGAAYLPLEPRLPVRRLEWLVADARPRLLLTHRAMPRVGGGSLLVLHLDEPLPAPPPAAAQSDLAPDDLAPDDLAYVIYTSGSTGRPKGVLVPHRGAGNVASGEAAVTGLTAADRVAQLASCSYDVSIVETILAGLHGATLVIAPVEATLPGPDLVRFLRRERITVANLSPSVLGALPDVDLPDLATLLVGGEPSTAELVRRWAPRHLFVNAYGPTETSISAAAGACRPDGCRPPIGRPLPGTHAYVLDAGLEPVAPGVPGELFVAGAGVARGYLGRPDLTAQRFLPDPFAGGGSRMYRTGDLVRWLPDGALDFLGRLDDQVQIGGVRVEPGEVTARLRELFDLRDAAVVPRPSRGGTELVAYLVAGRSRPPLAQLRATLRAELPSACVPSAFVFLDELPLNASHKLDRAALPPPTPADRGVTGRTAPRSELERAVAAVWADVLGHESVGVRDHFFDDLGGSSLQVPKVTGELAERLGLDVPVTHLFEHPTVEALAKRLGNRRRPGPAGSVDSTGPARPAGPAGSGGSWPQPEDQAAARRAALARRTRRG